SQKEAKSPRRGGRARCGRTAGPPGTPAPTIFIRCRARRARTAGPPGTPAPTIFLRCRARRARTAGPPGTPAPNFSQVSCAARSYRRAARDSGPDNFSQVSCAARSYRRAARDSGPYNFPMVRAIVVLNQLLHLINHITNVIIVDRLEKPVGIQVQRRPVHQLSLVIRAIFDPEPGDIRVIRPTHLCNKGE